MQAGDRPITHVQPRVAAAACALRATARSAARHGRRARRRRRCRTPTCASKRCYGFAGGDFLGQRTFATQTNAKGEWALLGVQGRYLGVRRDGARPAAGRGRAAVQPGRAGQFRNRPAHPDLASAAAAVAGCPPETSAGYSRTPPRPPRRLARIASRRCSARLRRQQRSRCPVGRRQHLPADARCRRRRDRSFVARSIATRSRFARTLGMGSSALMQRKSRGQGIRRRADLTNDKDERGYLTTANAEPRRIRDGGRFADGRRQDRHGWAARAPDEKSLMAGC